MWLPCTTVIDEPIMLLFWEFQDFQILILTPCLLQFLLGPGMAFGGALLLAIAVYFLKRGKPSGAVLHWLIAQEFLAWPGILGPYPQRYSPW